MMIFNDITNIHHFQARQTYVKRVIAHPSFHNVDYRTSEKLLASMEQGDVVIRPSSKVTRPNCDITFKQGVKMIVLLQIVKKTALCHSIISEVSQTIVFPGYRGRIT